MTATVRYLHSINGSGGVPGQLRPVRSHVRRLHPSEQTPDPDATGVLVLTDLEASLCMAALRASKSPSMHRLADDIGVQWAARSKPAPRGGA